MIPADVDRSDDYKAGYEDACKKWADLIVERPVSYTHLTLPTTPYV